MKIWKHLKKLRNIVNKCNERIKPFLQYPLRFSKKNTLTYILLKLICSFVPMVTILCIEKFIDIMMFSIQEENFCKTEIIWIVTLLAVAFSFEWVVENLDYRVSQLIKLDVLPSFYEIIIEKKRKIGIENYEESETCDLIYRVSSNFAEKITNAFVAFVGFVELIIQIGSLLLIVGERVWWSMFVLMLVSIPLVYYSVKFGEDSYEFDVEISSINRENEYLTKLLTLRDYAHEKKMFQSWRVLINRWSKTYREYRVKRNKQQMKSFVKTKVAGLILDFAAILIIFIIFYLYIEGLVNISLFIAYTTAVFNFLSVMSWNFTYYISEVYSGMMFYRDFNNFQLIKNEKIEGIWIKNISNIEFSHVTFSYPNSDDPVLKDVSMYLKNGQHYAIVGDNGAGKSTFIKLVLGIYDDYSGMIKINGIDLKKLNKESVRNALGVINQIFGRYNVSVEEYIFGAEKDYDADKLNNEISERFGEKLTLKTLLGNIYNEGVNLSGGEWQKLALLRLFYQNKETYIFDEPTASLDPLMEERVFEDIDKMFKDKLTIVVTHRMSYVKNADYIYLFSNGKVIEHGVHEGLLNQNGHYALMYNTQRSLYK